jgi:hypothetical protein
MQSILTFMVAGVADFSLWSLTLIAIVLLCSAIPSPFRRALMEPEQPVPQNWVHPAFSLSWAEWTSSIAKSFGGPAREDQPRKRRMVILLLLLGLIGTGLLLRALANLRLAAAKAVAGKDDPFWRIDDLPIHRSVVPDAENSARVVEEVLTSVRASWPADVSTHPDYWFRSASLSARAYRTLIDGANNVALPADETVVLREELE